jgi:hypothetical protein
MESSKPMTTKTESTTAEHIAGALRATLDHVERKLRERDTCQA